MYHVIPQIVNTLQGNQPTVAVLSATYPETASGSDLHMIADNLTSRIVVTSYRR